MQRTASTRGCQPAAPQQAAGGGGAGMCWTAGIELMLNADMVVAADNCRFAHLEVLRGIPASGGSTVRFSAGRRLAGCDALSADRR